MPKRTKVQLVAPQTQEPVSVSSIAQGDLSETGRAVFAHIQGQMVQLMQVHPEDAAALLVIAWKLAMWEGAAGVAATKFGAESDAARQARGRLVRMRRHIVEADGAAGAQLPDWLVKEVKQFGADILQKAQ